MCSVYSYVRACADEKAQRKEGKSQDLITAFNGNKHGWFLKLDLLSLISLTSYCIKLSQ